MSKDSKYKVIIIGMIITGFFLFYQGFSTYFKENTRTEGFLKTNAYLYKIENGKASFYYNVDEKQHYFTEKNTSNLYAKMGSIKKIKYNPLLPSIFTIDSSNLAFSIIIAFLFLIMPLTIYVIEFMRDKHKIRYPLHMGFISIIISGFVFYLVFTSGLKNASLYILIPIIIATFGVYVIISNLICKSYNNKKSFKVVVTENDAKVLNNINYLYNIVILIAVLIFFGFLFVYSGLLERVLLFPLIYYVFKLILQNKNNFQKK